MLRNAIKGRKQNALQHINAHTLKLWSVPIPVDDGLEAKIRTLDFDGISLSPVRRLSKIFPDLDDEHLHVVAQAPVGEFEYPSVVALLTAFLSCTR